MNIWIFNHYAITPNYPGGTRHFELGRILAGKGHKVTIFASNFIHMNFNFVDLEAGKPYKIETFDNLRFIWLQTRQYSQNDWSRVRNMLDYSKNAEQVTQKLVKNGQLEAPDVVIGSTVHPFAALRASKIARRHKAPFIFEIRDLWPQSFIDLGVWDEKSYQSRFFNFIENKTVARARKIIALSPQTGGYLQERYGYAAEDTHYIPNGVYIGKTGKQDEESTDSEPALQAMGGLKSDGSNVVLYSGSLISTNKLETIIEAAALLQGEEGLRIVMIGKGQEEARYRGLIQSKGLSNISILPPVKKENVPRLLRKADVLLLNQGNVLWGSSNKLYDYLASGRPIISSMHAKHNDVVSKIGGGLSVPPENPWQLAEAIRSMFKKSQVDYDRMKERNIAYVTEHHDWHVLAQRLEKTVKDAIGNKD